MIIGCLIAGSYFFMGQFPIPGIFLFFSSYL